MPKSMSFLLKKLPSPEGSAPRPPLSSLPLQISHCTLNFNRFFHVA